MITMDLDPSRRSRLHADQRYILILLLFRYTISLFVNLTIPEDPLLYPNDWDQCYFLIMLFFVYLEVNSFISAFCLYFLMIWCTYKIWCTYDLMHRNRQGENCYIPMRSCCCCYANPCWAILFRCSKFVSGTLFISCVYLNFR